MTDKRTPSPVSEGGTDPRGVDWRAQARANARYAEAARATARVAIDHLQRVLNGCRTAAEQQAADTAARDWLESIGG